MEIPNAANPADARPLPDFRRAPNGGNPAEVWPLPDFRQAPEVQEPGRAGQEFGDRQDNWLTLDGKPRWSVWLWGGGTYVDTGEASADGFGEGLAVGYRVSDAIGVYVGASFNHIDSVTQALGTLGVQRFGDPNGANAFEHTTLWVFWDQYTDTATHDGLGQLRVHAGYVINPNLELGALGSVATDDQGAAFTPFGTAATMFPGSNFAGAYGKLNVFSTDITATLGYSDAVENIAGGVQAEYPITQRMNIGLGVNGTGDGAFTASAYLELGLARMDMSHY